MLYVGRGRLIQSYALWKIQVLPKEWKEEAGEAEETGTCSQMRLAQEILDDGGETLPRHPPPKLLDVVEEGNAIYPSKRRVWVCCQLTGAQLLVNRVNETFFKVIVLVRLEEHFFPFFRRDFSLWNTGVERRRQMAKGAVLVGYMLFLLSFSRSPVLPSFFSKFFGFLSFFSFGLSFILLGFALSHSPQTCSRAPPRSLFSKKFLRAIRHPPLRSLPASPLSLSRTI